MAHAWCSATAAGGVQGVQEAKQAIVRARGTRLARARACAPAAARERCAHSPVAASCGAARAAEPAASSLRAAGAARGSREEALSRASASPSVSSARRGGGLGALRTRQRRQRLRQGLFAIQARRARGAAAARPVSALFAAPSVCLPALWRLSRCRRSSCRGCASGSPMPPPHRHRRRRPPQQVRAARGDARARLLPCCKPRGLLGRALDALAETRTYFRVDFQFGETNLPLQPIGNAIGPRPKP